MNDQSGSLFSPDTRGQLLVATAIAVALFVITAAALANTLVASNTDRRAGIDTDSQRIADALAVTTHHLEIALTKTNQDPNVESETERRNSARAEIQAALAESDKSVAHKGGTVTGDIQPLTDEQTVADGYRIAQTKSSEFRSAANETDWFLMQGAETTRVLTAFVETASLQQVGNPDNPSVDVFTTKLSGRVDGSLTTIDVQLYADGSDPILRYETGDGGTATCRLPDSPNTTVDFIGGRLNHTRCVDYPSFDTIRTVEFEEGQRVEGTYHTVYRGTEDDGDDFSGQIETADSPPEPGTADTPVGHHAVYAVAVRVQISTANGNVEKTLIVAPGSINDPYGHRD